MKVQLVAVLWPLCLYESITFQNWVTVVHSFTLIPNYSPSYSTCRQILQQPERRRRDVPSKRHHHRSSKRRQRKQHETALYGVWSKIQNRLSSSKKQLSSFTQRRRKEDVSQSSEQHTPPSSYNTIEAETTTTTMNEISSILANKNNKQSTYATITTDERDGEQHDVQSHIHFNNPAGTSFRMVDVEPNLGIAATAVLENVHTIGDQTIVSSLSSTTNDVQLKQIRLHLDEMPIQNNSYNNNTAMIELSRAKRAAVATHKQLYTLPRINRDLSKLEAEFRSMIEHFANYSEADLLSIPDPRKRALFEGIASSSHSRPVYRAFEILFEDLLPLRYAGRIVFSKLKEFMATSIEQRQQDMDTILNITGMKSIDDIQRVTEIRLMFVSTASQLNSASYLTLEQIAQSGIISATATEVLGFDNVTDVLIRLDKSSTGRITFVDLLVGLWELSSEYCGLDLCNPQVVLHNLLVELNEHPPPPTDLNSNLDSNRQRYTARYDEMVSSFTQWKHLLPPLPNDSDELQHHEGRRMEVVRGCFAGAELPKVVDALRVVYVDYAGLRVAGDIIYKLASTILKRR